MRELYKKYCSLNIDGSRIGFEHDSGEKCFCTPQGAEIIGCDNGLQYCFVDGFDETVFCVNPESGCEHYVYPIAKSFCDFLRLMLAVGGANALQQIIWMNKDTFYGFVNSEEEVKYRLEPQTAVALNTIKESFALSPMKEPFEYVTKLQSEFDYDKIAFSDEYYDTLGIERPNGTSPKDESFEFEKVEFRFEHR